MKILIVSATYLEINNFFNENSIFYNENSRFYSIKIKNKEIDIIITGVGMISTSYLLGKIFNESKYDLAINIGIAGAFNNKLKIGDVVNVVEEYLPELGIKFKDKIVKASTLNLFTKKDILKSECLKNSNYNLPDNVIDVKSLTVNSVSGDIETANSLNSNYNADIESMEGAAFMYACVYENIKFVQLRAISNYVGDRDKNNWDIPKAVENLNSTLNKIIDNI